MKALVALLLAAIGTVALCQDPLVPQQWHLNACGFHEGSGSGIIGAIDTGVTVFNDIQGQIVPGWNFYDNGPDTTDGFSHGTFTASAAVAIAYNGIGGHGCAPQARIMPLAVYPHIWTPPLGSITVPAVADAINHARQEGIKVIYCSVGPDWLFLTDNRVIRAIERFDGIIFWATGNDGVETVTIQPMGGLVFVGGLYNNPIRWATFSNYGPYVGFSAPGSLVVSAPPPAGGAMGMGTSFSAPIAACVASDLWGEYPNWTREQILERMRLKAMDVSKPGWDAMTGWGMVYASR